MRPSSTLIALVLISAAVTVFTSVWWRDMSYFLLLMWLALAALTVADLAISNLAGRMTVDFDLPPQGFVGHTAAFTVGIRSQKGALSRKIEIRLDLAPELVVDEIRWLNPASGAGEGEVKASLDLRLTRRGRYAVNALWLKWPSRLKLLEIIAKMPVGQEIAVQPDISPVLSGAIKTQILPLEAGQKDLRLRGEGSEFHQLREFVSGMDPRSIDWKRSARMRSLVVREMRAERNHQIILCVDSGRLMAEQLAGFTKLDRAINAALATCWGAGLAGDLVGFYSFDSRPRLFVPALPGRAAFPRLQTVCAGLRYETQETNHTLGLTHLSGRLKRRSLIVIFSDFVDTITAELMIENMQVLARHHFVVYVALRDPMLAKLIEPEETTLDAVARSVAARQILQERRAVMEKLARLGVLCLDSTPEALTSDLIARYIEIKSREMI
ncbi:DUF58 domain-containing protein (plasmid) [Rhizobium ruizarguesonis]|uniref:DUF58 domain-containing protein n=1 Tax=Rhizobium ruizarguesonis TaxID=2081791 RepID=UPI00102F2FD9|nr:DUF58 domain-containing protein [Rhizobium ruizarguesonis]MBY5828458.1 DUF58 domain-containing protein [Rhizobium leguminosarum]MBY5857231.1 DUF58 domain-containing protein [Rhizobium leguminosarum]NEJ08496.1 DUF58 domain-containing protein [Rhizobium ruizarguesonis]NEJ92473.1 DUF58 domain-containing protein [Rhizobium ruizarguesonis]TAT97799.1 DUF58 domain-containing protein [Rhizobium ruizarguesonis]